MSTTKYIVVLLLAFVVTPFSYAYQTTTPLEVDDDTAIVVVWQNKYGKYKACGPVQKNSASYNTAEEAMGYASNHNTNRYVGKIGKYSIFSCDEKLTRADFDARKCIK